MAIEKQVVSDNGIITEYHRIAMIQSEINQQNTILVHSYLSEAGRQVEKDYASGIIGGDSIKFPYVEARYLHPEYDGTMTVEKAYEWIKALPIFEGAEDC